MKNTNFTAYDTWLMNAPEDITVATDWQGEPLQAGDEVYDTPDGFVLVDDIADYHGGVKVLDGNHC